MKRCGRMRFVSICTQWKLQKKLQEPKRFTNRFNITNKINLVWKNSHNTMNHQEIVTY